MIENMNRVLPGCPKSSYLFGNVSVYLICLNLYFWVGNIQVESIIFESDSFLPAIVQGIRILKPKPVFAVNAE